MISRSMARYGGPVCLILATLVPPMSTSAIAQEPGVAMVVELPRPTGAFRVGQTRRHFVDPTRPETFTQDPVDDRELMVTFWYPASETKDFPPAQYMEDSISNAYSDQDSTMPADFGRLVRTFSQAGATISIEKSYWPVVVFSHGHGTDPALYTSLLENLASHGYVVAAINHTFSSMASQFPGGRVVSFTLPWAEGAAREEQGRALEGLVDLWSHDVQFVIDELHRMNEGDSLFLGRLALDRLAVMGHSLGGPSVGMAAMRDDRIKASIHLDSSIYGGKRIVHGRPLLLFNTEETANNRERYEGLNGEYHHIVVLGSRHMDYSDSYLLDFIDPAGSGVARAREVVALINTYILEFLSKYIRGEPAPLLDVQITLTRN